MSVTKIVLSFLFSLIAFATHADDNLTRNFAMFPNAKVAPPIPVAADDGKLYIPGWTAVDRPQAFYVPEDGTTAGFFQIITKNDGYTIDTFFDHILSEAAFEDIQRPPGLQAEAFSAVFGPMVAAVFGKAKYNGEQVRFFADLYGPNDDNKVTGTIIYAPVDVFQSWDGVLLPLVQNGYVEDPAMFENRDVMTAGNDAEQTSFYVGMVNTKVISEFNTLGILSEGAMQSARNASTIAGCAGASNCSVSYDGMGNAVADFYE